MTAHSTSKVDDVSAPVARGHARTCKGVLRPKADQVLSLWRLLTHGRRRFYSSKPLPLLCRSSFAPKTLPISQSTPLKKCIGRSPHPPQTPAAQFKRLYRNCPGRKSPAQSCLVCRGSPDRDLTFLVPNPARSPGSRLRGHVRSRLRPASQQTKTDAKLRPVVWHTK